MRVLKYHMEIRTVLQAKTEGQEFRDNMTSAPDTATDQDRHSTLTTPRVLG